MSSRTILVQILASRGRCLLGSFGLAAALLSAALLVLTLLPAAETSADGPDDGEVVVIFPGEQGTVRPISFTTSISRVGALILAGWEVEASGETVCSIEGVGCPASDCFCPDNWWSSAGWDSNSAIWDTLTWPPPAIVDGDIAGFRWSNTNWGPPLLPGSAYTAALQGLDWLRPRQSEIDGGYGNASGTVEGLLSVGSNRHDAGKWRRQADSPSLLGYFLANGPAYANASPAQGGKMAVGLTAANGCWPAMAMEPLVHYSPTTGIFGSSFGSGFQAWAILGTTALSQTTPASATTVLKNAQQGSGGWEWSPGWGADTNSTALAIQALLAAGESSGSVAIVDGLAYLDSAQNNDGGFPYDPISPWGTDSDTNSTAYVVQAILAAGQDPMAGAWVISGANPISYLLGMQLSDGSFEWQPGFGPNQIATQQAIPALLNRSFPLQVTDLDRCPVYYMPLILKQAN